MPCGVLLCGVVPCMQAWMYLLTLHNPGIEVVCRWACYHNMSSTSRNDQRLKCCDSSSHFLMPSNYLVWSQGVNFKSDCWREYSWITVIFGHKSYRFVARCSIRCHSWFMWIKDSISPAMMHRISYLQWPLKMAWIICWTWSIYLKSTTRSPPSISESISYQLSSSAISSETS